MNILGELLPPILDNLLGYDLLIILMAAGTLAYFIFILRHADKVSRLLNTRGYLPDDVFDEEEYTPPTKAAIKEQKLNLREMRETTEKYYSMFSNLTGTFPLMGILGTVISLIPLVQNIENMQQNFFIALTSTLWGLIFAVIFRLLDGVLVPRLEMNNRGIDDFLEKLESVLTKLKADAPVKSGESVAPSLELAEPSELKASAAPADAALPEHAEDDSDAPEPIKPETLNSAEISQ
ncbi:MAG: MotA/TolQ/ExbB proton channel family protein [Defluviitaleaceae bacterium]|nr:MotA/TolQ/ExbB proton channel family protein [Defluviitaleaceae bacterium]